MDYEIVIHLSDGTVINDIIFFSVIRTPLIKMCSYATAKVRMSAVAAFKLQNEVTASLFPKIKVSIYKIDQSQEADAKKRKVSLLAVREYLILQLFAQKDGVLGNFIDPTDDMIEVVLILTNPILYSLGNNFVFNKIHENSTCMDVINQYEAFLKSLHGDCFNFVKIIDAAEENKFKYEQLFIRVNNDLNVPSFLITNYKPFSTYSIYFFDDFAIHKDNNKTIAVYFLNFTNKEKFKKIDVSKYYDVNLGNTPLRQISIADHFQSLINKENESFTFKYPDIKFEVKKQQQATVIQENPQPNGTGETTLDGERKVKVVSSDYQLSQFTQSTQFSNLYIPDTKSEAQKRYKKTRQFLVKNCEYIFEYQISNSLIDFPQFGYTYNLEIEDRSKFLYTPISIVNIFRRQSLRHPHLIHIARSLFLKFADS